MNQALYSFHQAHKERMARIEAKAYRPPVVIVPEPEPVAPPKMEEPRKPWFRMLGLVEPTIRDVQDVLCEFYGHDRQALLSPRRDMPLCFHRQIGFLLCKKMTKRSLPEIGRRFGGRDHTTVLHGIRAATKRAEADPELQLQIDDLTLRIEERCDATP